MDYTDDTDSQDMGCAQIKSVESVESVGHEGCWGTLKPTDDTDGHGGPQAEFVGKQVSINDDRLFTHYIFSAVFIKLRKFLITCPHPCG